jgi:peptide/nickel transport system permease protein
MLPTLFGVTIVSFCIMQLAPGDPIQYKLGASGTAGQSSQSREAYLIQKRDLKLDKPLLLNTRYFYDYSSDVRYAAQYRAMSRDQIVADLKELSASNLDSEAAARLRFLRSLKVPKFYARLHPPELTAEQLAASGLTAAAWELEKEQKLARLAEAVQGYLLPWCEDTGIHGVAPAIAILRDESAPRELKIGAIRCLSAMVVSPFVYTFSRHSDEDEERRIVATWRRLWEQVKKSYPPVDPDRAKVLREKLVALAAAPRAEMFARLQGTDPQFQPPEFGADDVAFFMQVVFADGPRLEKGVAAEFVKLYVSARVQADVRDDATDQQIQEVADNWIAHFDAARPQYEHSFPAKVGYLFVDTQYAHMVWRLVTFRFGRSTQKTGEYVSERVGQALLVSVPIMLMAQLFIYLVAVPLGVISGVNRGKTLDWVISLNLFLLYSVPPFVAGMMFLLFFCYGSYVRWFPMERMHSPGAEDYNFVRYFFDYMWHAVLPVTCLSLFSLAGLAMYGRSAMLDVLGQDYIRTARAKGLPAYKVIIKHALRNALMPFITLFANFLPALLGGSVLIEYLFNIPGMGRLSFSCIEQKDIPTLMALIYIDAIVVMLSILLCDLLYVVADPRISFEGQERST